MIKVKSSFLALLGCLLAAGDGLLQPGGSLTGLLYFEHVGNDVDRLQLVADFMNAQSSACITRLSIPFVAT